MPGGRNVPPGRNSRAGPGRKSWAWSTIRVLARGEVQAGFDDRGADQHVKIAVPEAVHGFFKLRLRPSGREPCPRGRRERFFDVFGRPVQALNAVVNPEHLALAGDFAFQNAAQGGVVAVDEGRGRGLAFGGGVSMMESARGCRTREAGACAEWVWRSGSGHRRLRISFRRSLWRTPKRCSSSRMSRPSRE